MVLTIASGSSTYIRYMRYIGNLKYALRWMNFYIMYMGCIWDTLYPADASNIGTG